MTTQDFCDGCGLRRQDGEAFEPLGEASSGVYCSKCASVVSRYLRDRAHLHADIMANWEDRLAWLQEYHEKNHPGVKIPDE